MTVRCTGTEVSNQIVMASTSPEVVAVRAEQKESAGGIFLELFLFVLLWFGG